MVFDMNSTVRETPFGEIDINTLVDIQDVVIDTSMPQEERMKSYLSQIKNPYLYRCDDIIVRVSFADNGASLLDRLKQYLFSWQGKRL
jgi:hypothetical protein